MTARLRRARPGEAASLTDLAFRSKASNGYDAAFMEACRAELTYTAATMAAGETWVAEADGALVGFFDLRPTADGMEVFAIFVEPACRGGGVGRALWGKLEARARAAGSGAIGLDADPFAVRFYRAMGCEIVGEAPSGSIPGRMLPRMRKALC